MNRGQLIQLWISTSEESKYLICNASDIELGSWLGQETFDIMQPARFQSRMYNPAHLKYATLQEELLAIINSLKCSKALLQGTKFTILTDHIPLEIFIDHI